MSKKKKVIRELDKYSYTDVWPIITLLSLFCGPEMNISMIKQTDYVPFS